MVSSQVFLKAVSQVDQFFFNRRVSAIGRPTWTVIAQVEIDQSLDLVYTRFENGRNKVLQFCRNLWVHEADFFEFFS